MVHQVLAQDTTFVGQAIGVFAAGGIQHDLCATQLLRDCPAPTLDTAKDDELSAYVEQRKNEIPDAWY